MKTYYGNMDVVVVVGGFRLYVEFSELFCFYCVQFMRFFLMTGAFQICFQYV